MSKKVVILGILIIMSIIGVYWGLFYTDKSCEGKIVYPLSNIKNDGANWILSITEVGNEDSFIVLDQQVLYDNRDVFKITLRQDVYWSTPAYFVKILKNGREIQNYPLLNLEQIEFGTIPFSKESLNVPNGDVDNGGR